MSKKRDMRELMRAANPYQVDPRDGQTLQAQAGLDRLVPGARAQLAAQRQGLSDGGSGLAKVAPPWRRRLVLGVAGTCGVVLLAGGAYLGLQAAGFGGGANKSTSDVAAGSAPNETWAETAAEPTEETDDSSAGGAAEAAAEDTGSDTSGSADSADGGATEAEAPSAAAPGGGADEAETGNGETGSGGDSGTGGDTGATDGQFTGEGPLVLDQARPAALDGLPQALTGVVVFTEGSYPPGFVVCLLLDPATLTAVEAGQVVLDGPDTYGCGGLSVLVGGIDGEDDAWAAIADGSGTVAFDLTSDAALLPSEEAGRLHAYRVSPGQGLVDKYVAFYLDPAGQVTMQVFTPLL
ncbi:MAG: hypothetical protein LBR27_07125 [Bifidobacteriaceae bacterium]|jgi:hypothetical protein|nr:hypothetical protein [Bifidobacteriaceae bacterium]